MTRTNVGVSARIHCEAKPRLKSETSATTRSLEVVFDFDGAKRCGRFPDESSELNR
jgi:hypothetical protein